MTDDTIPYITAKPGDLVTSEIWNGVQVDIKKDIQSSIQDVEKKIKGEGVDKADDADKFSGKTPADWIKDLDQLYAQKVHSHEGQSVYRKYYNRFTANTQSVLLKHGLGAFPLVDVYELMYVFDTSLSGVNQEAIKEVKSSDGKPPKFFLYFDHDDKDKYGMYTSVYRDRVNLGIPINKALTEYSVDWKESDSFVDVVEDLWDNLFASPNDEISYASSPSIGHRKDKTVKTLIGNGEWDDIYLAFRPRKFTMIPEPILTISHVNYDTLMLEINKVYFKLWPYLEDFMLQQQKTLSQAAGPSSPVLDKETIIETLEMLSEQAKLVEQSELDQAFISDTKQLDHVDVMTLLRI